MSNKLYSHKPVKYWYAYTVEDISALYSKLTLHPQTIRGWVKNGLNTIDSGKPALIYGNDLIVFLKSQNSKNKCKTAFDEMFCMKCKDARNLFQRKAAIKPKAKNLFVSGHCRECKTVMFKSYKMNDLPKLKRTFLVVGVLELYDCKVPPCKTHLQAHDVTPLNESLNPSNQRDLFG